MTTPQAHPPSPEADTDEALMLRFVRQADATALDRLVASHADRAFALAWRITGDGERAADAVQEAWIRVVRTAARYDGSVPFSAWIFRLVSAAAIDQRRSHERRRQRERAIARTTATSVVDVAVESDEQRDEPVRTALAGLPDRYRMPLMLHYLAGLDQAETARALGLKPSAVSMRLARGRDRMRDRLVRMGVTASAVVALDVLTASPAPASPAVIATVPTVGVSASAIPMLVGKVMAALACAGVAVAATVALASGPSPSPMQPASIAPAVAGLEGNGRLIGVSPFQCPAAVECLAVSPDSKRLLVGTADGIVVWDLATRSKVLQGLRGHYVVDCRFADQGRSILAMTMDSKVTNKMTGNIFNRKMTMTHANKILLLDAGTGALRTTFTAPVYFYYGACDLSPDGQTLAAVSRHSGNPQAFLWDVASGKVLPTIADATHAADRLGHRSLDDCSFSPDGRLLACLDSGGGVTITDWSTKARTAAWPLPGGTRAGWKAQLSWIQPDRLRLVDPEENGVTKTLGLDGS
ncbi:MAG: sigma-70 family RNA polymerase sigma factor, partial [Planctomycetes bacterium]|nr:sigma-70 family RNA polymerase sigma factor [Planctomycetota bacterium]